MNTQITTNDQPESPTATAYQLFRPTHPPAPGRYWVCVARQSADSPALATKTSVMVDLHIDESGLLSLDTLEGTHPLEDEMITPSDVITHYAPALQEKLHH